MVSFVEEDDSGTMLINAFVNKSKKLLIVTDTHNIVFDEDLKQIMICSHTKFEQDMDSLESVNTSFHATDFIITLAMNDENMVDSLKWKAEHLS